MKKLLLHLSNLGKLGWREKPLWYRWLWCVSDYFSLRLSRDGKYFWVVSPLLGVQICWGAKRWDMQLLESGVRLSAIPKRWTLLYAPGDQFYRYSWEWMKLTFPQQGG